MLRYSAVEGTRVLAILALALTGCNGEPKDDPSAYAHILPFDTATVRIASAKDTTRLTLELAESEEQKTLGLMERRTLPPDAGMLFIYSATQPTTSAFWMFRARIPLEIAYVDSSGVIRSIVAMQPCESNLAQGCPTYPSGAAYRAALEVNAGFFARKGIRVGDRLLLGDTTSRRRALSRGP